jgi:phosphoribosylaminoimidazole carboxylase
VILEVGASASAKQIFALTTTYLSHINGSFTDLTKIRELAAKVDVLTVEIEHIDADVLEEAQRQRTDEMEVEVHPAPSTTIRTIQDEFQQKVHLQSHALHIAPFLEIVKLTIQEFKETAACLGLPFMQKQEVGLRRARKSRPSRSIACPDHLKVNEMVNTLSSTHTLCSSAKEGARDNVS